ncbi:hypothetical protein LTSEMON_3896 [Salmonella enterica subsp. enterica serovar Montevideo str. S5-403]|uniref:Uncharacterized protein n=1 Tax=Salmonella enterica subsp. enterica serovar Montevideo str. S5-403 TaxID=913242 RepID=G5Q6L0_SALMO|nr:hypothetical protein LTSEMON_3896 [Salmonella enterica subsp. enterica serovar Montevideo str. S5-403]
MDSLSSPGILASFHLHHFSILLTYQILDRSISMYQLLNQIKQDKTT